MTTHPPAPMPTERGTAVENESEPHDCCGEMRWQRSVCEECGHQEAWCASHGTTCGCPTPAESDPTAGERPYCPIHWGQFCQCTITPAEPDPTAGERCVCGNDFNGDNLCMRSACQWEGIDYPAEPDAGDVEELARIISQANFPSSWVQGESLIDGDGEPLSPDSEDYECARAILASDWLDAVRRKATEDRAERIAQAIEAARDVSQAPNYRAGFDVAARIARTEAAS